LFYDQGRSLNSRSLRKCGATVARGATRWLFACVSRGLPGHLECGISTSPKTQVKCSDFKHVVACLLAVGCRLSLKEIKNLLQLRRKKQIFRGGQASATQSHWKFQWLSNEIDLPTFLFLKGFWYSMWSTL